MVVDTNTLKVVGDIPDLSRIHGVALAPELSRGFVSNGGDNTVTVFDLKTLKKLDSVKVGERPDAILYEPFQNVSSPSMAAATTQRQSRRPPGKWWGACHWEAGLKFRRATAKERCT